MSSIEMELIDKKLRWEKEAKVRYLFRDLPQESKDLLDAAKDIWEVQNPTETLTRELLHNVQQFMFAQSQFKNQSLHELLSRGTSVSNDAQAKIIQLSEEEITQKSDAGLEALFLSAEQQQRLTEIRGKGTTLDPTEKKALKQEKNALTKDCEAVARLKRERREAHTQIDAIDNDVFKWRVMFEANGFAGKLQAQLLRCADAWGPACGGITLEFEFPAGLYPYFPPTVKLVRPRCKGWLLGGHGRRCHFPASRSRLYRESLTKERGAQQNDSVTLTLWHAVPGAIMGDPIFSE